MTSIHILIPKKNLFCTKMRVSYLTKLIKTLYYENPFFVKQIVGDIFLKMNQLLL